MEDAAISLSEHLLYPICPKWFGAVGLGENELIVYVTAKHEKIPNTWEGFPVKIQRLEMIKC